MRATACHLAQKGGHNLFVHVRRLRRREQQKGTVAVVFSSSRCLQELHLSCPASREAAELSRMMMWAPGFHVPGRWFQEDFGRDQPGWNIRRRDDISCAFVSPTPWIESSYLYEMLPPQQALAFMNGTEVVRAARLLTRFAELGIA